MPMRVECKHYESRTYANGETVRKCDLDLAPEAPWRCPEDCPKYERRMADAAWAYGTMVSPPTPDEPSSLERGEDVAALLDAAEQVLNDAGPDIVAEVAAEKSRRKGWKRKLRRRRG
jgi:hypothetical protein